MGTVVDLSQWRRASGAARPAVAQLERALQRLDSLASEKTKRGGRLAMDVETELLAILGALAVGSVDDALARAERLADRLSGGKKARTEQQRS